MERAGLPCPVVELVPHRSPMCLIDRLESFADDHGEAVGEVAREHLFAGPGGAVHRSVLIEMVAQAAAAHEGFKRRSGGGEVGGGFIAGVRDFSFFRSLRIGDSFRVVVEKDLAIGAMQMARGRVERDGEKIAEGEMVFFLSDELVPEQMPTPAEPEIGATDGALGSAGVLQALATARSELDPARGRCVYRIDADFPAFSGHFPGYPILPAVVSVTIAERTVAAVEGCELELDRIRRAKFRRPILPGSTVEASCERREVDRPGSWKVVLRLQEEVVAQMDLHARVGSATDGGTSTCG